MFVIYKLWLNRVVNDTFLFLYIGVVFLYHTLNARDSCVYTCHYPTNWRHWTHTNILFLWISRNLWNISKLYALFAWLISHGWKYCWLICCERKILFVGWKVQLISQTNRAYDREHIICLKLSIVSVSFIRVSFSLIEMEQSLNY